MDQKKIGKFIAECRKEKKLTQSELAEKLGVTDKSISNWENARCMPDLSLFTPLCEELGITINDLISGERVKKEEYQEKLEKNIISTIDYSNKKVYEKNKIIGLILLVFGVLISLTAVSIFSPDSSWCSIYSVVGSIVSVIGFSKIIEKLNYIKKFILCFIYFIVFLGILVVLDFVNVMYNREPPRFSYIIESGDDAIVYKSLFCDVYRLNRNTKNEYYIIDTKRQYRSKSLPSTPFNRDISGIDNIIKYKNKYVGDNSNDGALINSLPLSEYGYVFEIDSDNFGLKINYHITDWYINENNYLEKCLVYNSVAIFSLIDNVEYIEYNFSGRSYKVKREDVEKKYPNYEKINYNGNINRDNFNKYLENKLDNEEFIINVFSSLISD